MNPIRDGLNLVAYEGALVNDRDAVLVLSAEAGAWERLARARPSPCPRSTSSAHRGRARTEALTMPADERRPRAARLRELAEARTPEHWLADQLAAAD